MSEAPSIEVEPKPDAVPPEVETAPVEEKTPEKPKRWWQVWRKSGPKPPKRALLVRLFGVGIWGWIKLILLCVFVGFIMLAMQFDPASEEFGARQAMSVFLENLIATSQWAVENGWKPALLGSTVVLPVWVLWRLMTLPFRR